MKAIKTIRIIIVISTAVIFTAACTEKIDLKLANSDPQLVIEANVSDKPGPYFVSLSQSKLYYEPNDFTGVDSALVVLSDDAGNTDTLTEILQGLYQTNFIQGTVGRTYHLQISVDGKIYSSYCKMQPSVNIDSVILSTTTGFQGSVKKEADILVRDPAGAVNFYRVVSTLNGYLSSGFTVYRDRLWDGKLRTFSVPHSDFQTGDTLTVDLWSIDSHVYDYFREFNQNQNNFGSPASPANPVSVFTPGALGYFSTHSIKSKTVIIP